MSEANIFKSQGNSATTTLASSVTNTDTSFPLTSDTNFAGEGYVIIDEGTASEEIAYATGKSGSSLTIPLANRGLEGTSAVGHASGATVKGVLTAGGMNQLADAILVGHNDSGSHKSFVVDGTSSSSAYIRLAEDTDNGTNYMGLKAPAAVTTNTDLVLPNGDGTAGQVLKTDGSGNLGWLSKASGAEVTTGTDDDKFVTAKALTDANVESVGFATSGPQSTFSTASTSFVDVTGVTVTINPTRTVTVHATITGRQSTSAVGQDLGVQLLIDGNVIQSYTTRHTTATYEKSFALTGQASVASGARVIKLQGKTASGTGTFDQCSVSVIYS